MRHSPTDADTRRHLAAVGEPAVEAEARRLESAARAAGIDIDPVAAVRIVRGLHAA